MSDPCEQPDKWQRILEATRASRQEENGSAGRASVGQAPEALSIGLLSRFRALQASLNSWKRWSLIAGFISIVIFLASLAYLKLSADADQDPLIEAPQLELPSPPTPNKRQP